jgi:protocatechuate 3,4-dioxygenase beta subunit
MNRDDSTIGTVLTRRQALGLMAATSCGLLGAWPAAQAAGSGCVVRPAQTEGPYFRDEQLDRSDLRTDPANGRVSPGTPVVLDIVVSRLAGGACAPLPGARVDIWHADHLGRYSGVRDQYADTTGLKFLRGYQTTDAAGRVQFTTIYPGWYPSRTVHFHFKVRTMPASGAGHEFTSQLYFDDALSDEVFEADPYRSREGKRKHNADDRIFASGGSGLMVGLARRGEAYAGRFDIALEGIS